MKILSSAVFFHVRIYHGFSKVNFNYICMPSVKVFGCMWMNAKVLQNLQLSMTNLLIKFEAPLGPEKLILSIITINEEQTNLAQNSNM